jgi:hypothetical protein
MIKLITKSPHQILTETLLLLIYDDELEFWAGLSYSYSIVFYKQRVSKMILEFDQPGLICFVNRVS